MFGAPVHSLPEGSGLLMQIRSTLPQRSALHSRDLQGDIASIPPDTPFVLLQSFLDNTFHNWEGLRNDSSPGREGALQLPSPDRGPAGMAEHLCSMGHLFQVGLSKFLIT